MKLYHLNSLFLLLLYVSCSITQKSVNESDVKINYDGSPKGKVSRIVVYFTGGFNDSLLVTQNKSILNKDFFKSDWSTSFTGVVVKVELNKGNELQIIELNTGKKVLVKLIEGYRIIELSKYSNEWAILYSNRPLIFE